MSSTTPARTRHPWVGAVAIPALTLGAISCASGGVGTSGGTGGTSSAASSTVGSGGATATSSSVSASSSGAGPSSSSGGGGGASSSAGSSGSGGGGPVCHWKINDPCGAGMFCQADGCGDGTCQPVGTTEDQTRQPVCGCDGVTYWNASVAAKHGMPAQSLGECSPAKTCGGFANQQCPAGASCNYRQADKTGCGIADGSGTCWTVPSVCVPMAGIGPQTRGCGSASCTDECDLIKLQTLWYPDSSCPQ